MRRVLATGSISVSIGWENDQAVLILENCGHHQERILIHYQITKSSGTVLWECVQLFSGERQTKKLPKGFEKWHKFYCLLDGKKQISNTPLDLKELVNDNQIDAISKYPQVEIIPSISNIAQANDPSPLIREESEHEKETENLQVQISTDDQHEVETNVRDSQKHVTETENVSQADKAIDSVDIENPTPSQKVPIILNSIVHDIEKWINELDQSYVRNPDLVQTLVYAKQTIKEKLKTISNNEQGYEIDTAKYDQFIPQFIKDRLFNGVARFVPYEQLSEHLDTLLQLVGYEIIPIEIGKTKADARVHDIQGSRQTGVEPGTIAEVILPGLRWIIDSEIVQKPVVIRAE